MKQVRNTDAKPSKRIYRSIISDYDLLRSICELIDNALDLWVKQGNKNNIVIDIKINIAQQTITVKDNVGGIKFNELKYIVAPGYTTNSPLDEITGFFGVGSKRAVVALAQDIKIFTRYLNEKTYLVMYDDKWLEKEDEWELDTFEISDIEPSSTIIELTKLRYHVDDKMVDDLIQNLEVIYAKFLLKQDVTIKVNDEELEAIIFENWSYPPNNPPESIVVDVFTEDSQKVNVNITGGLSDISSPSGEYGVYIYCNDRLIARALKSSIVGFESGSVGLPHNKISLAKVFVFLFGPAELMPWNSSKSNINSNSEIFIKIRPLIIHSLKHFTQLSKRLKNWKEDVFPFTEGKIITHKLKDINEVKKIKFPDLPPMWFSHSDLMERVNKNVVMQKPWTQSIYETILLANIISKQKYSEKNQSNLILLDTLLEISLKKYLLFEKQINITDNNLIKLMKDRDKLISEVKNISGLNNGKWNKIWEKIQYYHSQKLRFIFSKETINVNDEDIQIFKKLIEDLNSELFQVHFL